MYTSLLSCTAGHTQETPLTSILAYALLHQECIKSYSIHTVYAQYHMYMHVHYGTGHPGPAIAGQSIHGHAIMLHIICIHDHEDTTAPI